MDVLATLVNSADGAIVVSNDIVLLIAMILCSFLAGLLCGVFVVPWLVDHDLFPFVHVRHDRQ